MTPEELLKNILSDMRAGLAEEFDRNFRRKGFFGERWKPRRYPGRRGTLLMVTGRMRRSIRARISGGSVRFTSDTPYAAAHNEGADGSVRVRSHVRRGRGGAYTVRAHSRRMSLPERRFIGPGDDATRIIRSAVDGCLAEWRGELEDSVPRKNS